MENKNAPMHAQIKLILREILEQFLATQNLDSENLADLIVLERPKKREFGHFATPISFIIAKKFKKNPVEIAAQILKIAQANSSAQFAFEKIELAGGYINLTLSAQFLNKLCQKALDGAYFTPLDSQSRQTSTSKISESKSQSCATHSQKILLEFVSANPTGPLHIGHARGAIYGDSLKRIGKFLGHKITTEYYVNDAGAQIFTLGLSVFLAGREILNLPTSYPKSYYRGEYITEIAQSAIEKFGDEIFLDSEKFIEKIADENARVQKDENLEFNLPALAPDSQTAQNITQLSIFGKDLMLDEIKNNLAELNIQFDNFVSEKELYSRWDATLTALQKNNGVQNIDGKIWLKSSEFGDEKDRVIVRENGESTYLAGDIIYHADKFSRDFERYINIWGADHHGYIARVKASIEILGYESARLEVLLAQMVALKKNGQAYKMSKRAGNFILLKDVVADIGADALRFVFLTKRVDTHLEFDVDDLNKTDASNPIFYINYANARIHTLLEKCGITESKFEILENDSKMLGDLHFLAFNALNIFQTLENAFKDREVQKLCEYLKNLAADFHAFYNAHKILDSQNCAYILSILRVVSASLTLGLSLIGIKAKTKM